MNSLAKIAGCAAALAAFTIPLKFIEESAPLDDVPAAAARIERFLAGLSDRPLADAELFTTSDRWTGWRFSREGCEAIAYPSPADGWLLERARVTVKEGETISLVYHGKIYDAPPRLANAWNVVADRLLVPVGLMARPDRLMILIVAPEECMDEMEALDWPVRLQSAEPDA